MGLTEIIEVADHARVPRKEDRVLKRECLLSFATSSSDGGLFVNMKTFEAFSEDFVDLDFSRTGSRLYCHVCETRKPKEPVQAEAPTRMAIGVEGGFSSADAYDEVETFVQVVVFPERISSPFPCQGLPDIVRQSVVGILSHVGGAAEQNTTSTWECKKPEASKYSSDLVQILDPPQIPPSNWKCAECGTTKNLWLNLSDGFVGCGRKTYQIWNGCVGGAEGAAIRHYESSGSKYPLAVKLGTLTVSSADIYSYAADEDDSIEDPFLAQHLAHFGINIKNTEKTEESLVEMEIALNRKFDWEQITESKKQLVVLDEPRAIGLQNLGSTCYMNAIMQVLSHLPEVEAVYLRLQAKIYAAMPRDVSAADFFPAQLAKLLEGLLTDKYLLKKNRQIGNSASSSPRESGEGCTTTSLCPIMFRYLIGKDHKEFASGRQQDACEFLQYVLNSVFARDLAALSEGALQFAASSRGAAINRLFTFLEEHRYQCVEESQLVAYRYNSETVLFLPVFLEDATNKEQLEAFESRDMKRQKVQDIGVAEPPVKARILFEACLAQFASTGEVELWSGGRNRECDTRTRLATFPPYLWVVLKRFYQKPDWTSGKLDALVEVPEELDIEYLRAGGRKDGESVLPTDNGRASNANDDVVITPDANIVAAITSMGYSTNAAIRACNATKNASSEGAIEWLFAHMDDSDVNDVPVVKSSVTAEIPPSAVSELCAMGFDSGAAECALYRCDMNTERAVDWLFSHVDSLPQDVENYLAEKSGKVAKTFEPKTLDIESCSDYLDGEGKYELTSFVTQLGPNLHCGHYVAHIKNGNRWVVFNDAKTALSEEPPTQHGYMYLYKRKDYAHR
eukprot:TRINITY_DN115418_c0_g1_i1.p1 TRINITY_DN115418_c0_g1~~TRINITY_DN115418_c0_g1_i1.p1  ORF type:complete len:849 (-),score=113.91 TRINITY_DN115418_c0_g1_i1:143-2689(-)